jgi:hypothetical protein
MLEFTQLDQQTHTQDIRILLTNIPITNINRQLLIKNSNKFFLRTKPDKIIHLRWQPKKCILHRWILSSNIDYVFRGVWGELVNNVQWN